MCRFAPLVLYFMNTIETTILETCTSQGESYCLEWQIDKTTDIQLITFGYLFLKWSILFFVIWKLIKLRKKIV